MSKSKDPNPNDAFDANDLLFGGAISESGISEDTYNSLHPSFESVAGLVELTATEMHEMPTFLQKSIMQKGKEFLRQNRDELDNQD